MVLRFINGYLLRHHELKKEELWVDNGKIIDPLSFKDLNFHSIETVDLEGLIISPGFIDIQVNGSFDVDFLNNPEKIPEVSQKLTRFGVTSFLPTLISSSPAHYRKILPQLEAFRTNRGANILGWHLEGPFLNPNKHGAHDPAYIASFAEDWTIEEFEDMYGSLDNVKIVTIAPELPGIIKIIPDLTKRGIVIAAGHSLANIEKSLNSFEAGISLVTHLFNAMPLMEQREPGLAGAILHTCLKEPIYYSVIVDKIHVHPVMIALAWKANSKGCILISDAISLLGSIKDEKKHFLGTQAIEINDNQAYLNDKKILAGGFTSLNHCLQNLIEITNCSLVEALETVSLKPAQLLKLNTKGQLLPGYDADFVIIDPALSIHMTFVNGSLCYSASKSPV